MEMAIAEVEYQAGEVVSVVSTAHRFTLILVYPWFLDLHDHPGQELPADQRKLKMHRAISSSDTFQETTNVALKMELNHRPYKYHHFVTAGDVPTIRHYRLSSCTAIYILVPRSD
jgi:hypothetical protein